MQTGPSYLAAFDRGTGKLLWKHDRMLDAPDEAAQSYSTPVVIAGDAAKGYIAAGFNVAGTNYPVVQEIQKN